MLMEKNGSNKGKNQNILLEKKFFLKTLDKFFLPC